MTLSEPEYTVPGAFTVSDYTAELVGGPCGMSNAQAALIAAAISTAKYDPRGIVLEVAAHYVQWLEEQDGKAEDLPEGQGDGAVP